MKKRKRKKDQDANYTHAQRQGRVCCLRTVHLQSQNSPRKVREKRPCQIQSGASAIVPLNWRRLKKWRIYRGKETIKMTSSVCGSYRPLVGKQVLHEAFVLSCLALSCPCLRLCLSLSRHVLSCRCLVLFLSCQRLALCLVLSYVPLNDSCCEGLAAPVTEM
jgi:hypothetical protein